MLASIVSALAPAKRLPMMANLSNGTRHDVGFLRTLVSWPFVLSLLFVLWAYLPILTLSVGIPVQDEGILFDPVYELIHHGRVAAPYMSPVGHDIDRVFWNHPPGNQYYMALFYYLSGDGILAVRIAAMVVRILVIVLFAYLVWRGVLTGWPCVFGIVIFLLSTYPVISVSRPDMLAGGFFLVYLLLLDQCPKSLGSSAVAGSAWALAILCHPLTLHFGFAALLTLSVLLIMSNGIRLKEIGRLFFLMAFAGTLFVILWLLPFAIIGGWADALLVIKGFMWHSSSQSTLLSWFEPSVINMIIYLPHYLLLGLLICPIVLRDRNNFDSTDVVIAATLLMGMLYILIFTFSGVWYFVTLAPAAVYLVSKYLGQYWVRRPALAKGTAVCLLVVCALTTHTSVLFRHPFSMMANKNAVYHRISEVTEEYIHAANAKSVLITPQFYHLVKLKTDITVDAELVKRDQRSNTLASYDAILLMDEHSGVFYRLSSEQIAEFNKRFSILYDSAGKDWIRSASIRSLGRPVEMPRFIVAVRKDLSPKIVERPGSVAPVS